MENDQPFQTEKKLSIYLGVLIATYSILTAITIFLGTRAESFANENNLYALTFLNDSSELQLSVRLQVAHETILLDQMIVNDLSGVNPEINEYLYSTLSQEAMDSIERSVSLDDEYWMSLFLYSDVERDLSTRSIDLAAEWSEREDIFQATATVLAVGLALAAWAALMEHSKIIQQLFAIIATIMLTLTLGYFVIQMKSWEPLEGSIDFDGQYQSYDFVIYQP